MACCIRELQDKDVININNGEKLGCVIDIEIDILNGRLCSIIVPGETKGFIFSKCNEIIIPWCKIRKIGEDTILVDLPNQICDDGYCRK